MALSTDPVDTHGHTVADVASKLTGGDGTAIALATSLAADDIIDTAAAHGLVENDVVIFTSLTGGTGLSTGVAYYVSATSLAATTFRVAATPGGAALGFTADITAGSAQKVGDAVAEAGALTAGAVYLAQSPAEVTAQMA